MLCYFLEDVCCYGESEILGFEIGLLGVDMEGDIVGFEFEMVGMF